MEFIDRKTRYRSSHKLKKKKYNGKIEHRKIKHKQIEHKKIERRNIDIEKQYTHIAVIDIINRHNYIPNKPERAHLFRADA